MKTDLTDLTLTSIKNIQEAMKNERLVLFVGSGISLNSGAPSWKNIIEEMAKELGITKKNFSQDEFLKIPQYYYNQYKEFLYNKKINQIFNKKISSNPINYMIFDLNPAYVITTNYDDLLEQVAPASYSVIRENSKMPYIKTSKAIIKMHGDFIGENIVLKEDDYLNYSTNFRLMETFIKSIIATHTVVFVGYSINDYNVNLIFQWVKEVLGKDHQPAYLLYTDTKPSDNINSKLVYDYYKHKNIYQLSYSNIKDVMNEFWQQDVSAKNNADRFLSITDNPLHTDIGFATYYFLAFIKYYYSNDSALDFFSDKLNVLSKLNSYFNYDIEDLLSE